MAETKKKPTTKTTTKKPTAKKPTAKKTTKKPAAKKATPKKVVKKEIKAVKKEIKQIEKPKMKLELGKDFKFPEVIILSIMFLVIGLCIGALVMSVSKSDEETDLIATEDAVFDKIETTYNYILNRYIDDITKEDLVEGAISGMLEVTGDPYTSYFDKEETTSFHKRLKGVFFGIGCEIISDGTNVYVAKVLDDSPAQRSGIQVWDILSKINGVSTTGVTAADAVKMIENSPTNDVDLVIIRNDEEINLTLTRGYVTIKSVSSKTFADTGYILIDIFAENTGVQFKEELLKLEAKGIDSLIIDVRDNSGGYLTSVADILSLFLAKDKIMYKLQTKSTIIEKYALTSEDRSYPVAVLMNRNSASGSEILAGAIKEMYNGEVIGTNSYGKSTVQQTADLGDGTMIKYTVQKWLTSLGNDVGENGLEPTIEIEQSVDYYTNPSDITDSQLQKAIEILNN